MSEKKFLKSSFGYIQRLCARHQSEVENDRIITWNMMQGKPPPEREEHCDSSPDISKDEIREAGKIVGNLGGLLSDGNLKKTKSV